MKLPYIAKATNKSPTWLPSKLSEASQTFFIDVNEIFGIDQRSIDNLAVSSAPSGNGELILSGLGFNGSLIELTTNKGVETRVYTIKFIANMSDGQILEFDAFQAIPLILNGYTIPLPPEPGFSTSITVNGPNEMNLVVAPIVYKGPPTVLVNPTSTRIAAAGFYTKSLVLQTLPGSAVNIYVRADGQSAVVGQGMVVFAGGGALSFGNSALPLPTGDIYAIADSVASQTLMITGG